MGILQTLLNKVSIPRDRILSARSPDCITWTREPGIRIEHSATHPSDSSFYCFVHQPEDLSGKYEMFYHGSSQKNGKWISRIFRSISEDGLNWEHEPEVVLDSSTQFQNLKQIRAPFLLDFKQYWRLYFTAKSEDGIPRIFSAVSQNRQMWDVEEGARISVELAANSGLEVQGVSDTSIVSLPDGSLRMYFSVYRDEIFKQSICSAVSSDGLNWRVEEGVRMDFGPMGYRFVAANPSVVRIDSRWRMLFRGSNNMPIMDKIFVAESEDGIHWHTLQIALAPNPECYKEKHEVAHPFLFKTREGFYRVYYTGCCGTRFQSPAYRYYENQYHKKGIEVIYD